jgi:hypothetical protein
MKKLIFILLTIITVSCCKTIEKPLIEIDLPLWGVVNEFVADAEEAGVNATILRDSLSYIVLMPLDANLYGVYTPKNRQVSINYWAIKDKYILRKVIYHELGHVLGLKHDVIGIMATNQSPAKIHNKYCPDDNPVGLVNWELHKTVLFRKILEIQKQ